MLTLVGAAESAKRMAPHWQPPVKTGFVTEAMLTPPTDRPLAAWPAHPHRQRQIRRRPRRGGQPPARRDVLRDRYALLQRLEEPLRPGQPARHRFCPGNINRPALRRNPWKLRQ